jgi:peptidoglycan/LPS O-acetylase OafA/YrhL
METIGITGFALLSTALVVISQHKIPFVQRVLAFRWLQLAGKYSYGMYVYHLFLIFAIRHCLGAPASYGSASGIHSSFPVKLLAMIAVVLAVFFVAKVSYDMFESRFLRLKGLFRPA